MRTHVSINVNDVAKSVEFYKRVFGLAPQKQTPQYAKFDLKAPALNFTMQSGGERAVSAVNHFGVEVDSISEVQEWHKRLSEAGVLAVEEKATNCCFARQDKIWFQDPDGNAWEIFVVHEQLSTAGPTSLFTPFDQPKVAGKKCC